MRIAVTPLKMRSERVPGKNFRELCGRPLYEWTLEPLRQLREEGLIDEIGVYGEPAIMDHVPSDVVLYPERTVMEIQDSNRMFRDMLAAVPEKATWCCIKNATSPFIRVDSIRTAMNAVIASGFDSAASMQAVRGRLWNCHYQSINHDPRTCPPTQTQAPIFIESDGFWILRRTFMREHGRRIGFHPWFQEVRGTELVDIDTEADWELAEHVGAGLCQKPSS